MKLKGPSNEPDPSMFVRGPFNEPLALEGVKPVNDGFVGGDLASELDLSDERGSTVFAQVALDELEDRLLLLGQISLGQGRLRDGGKDT